MWIGLLTPVSIPRQGVGRCPKCRREHLSGRLLRKQHPLLPNLGRWEALYAERAWPRVDRTKTMKAGL